MMRHRLKTIILYMMAVALCSTNLAGLVKPAAALASSNGDSGVVINEVKLGGTGTYPQFITIFNNSNASIVLNNWKLEYAKTSNSVQCQSSSWGVPASQIVNFSVTLPPYSLSSPIVLSLTDNKAGSIHLIDDSGLVEDLVGWGTDAPCYDASAVANPPSYDHSISRYIDCSDSYPIDTNNNLADFTELATPNPTGLSGQYITTCQSSNDNSGNNTNSSATCEGVIINEVLPNPSGADDGQEFIELFNPTSEVIPLDGCSLQTSASAVKFDLGGTELQPNEYRALYDGETGLTLPNSSGGTAWLLSPTEELQSINYPANLDDGVSWSLFADGWQSTYTLTPNAINILLATKPCPAGQYRDSNTYRCRNIISAGSTLKPCAPGKVRNPVTNRCHNATSALSGLKPCRPDQFRNPATNRCKSTASTLGFLTPCKPGQFRNPATNRCKSSLSARSLKPCKPGWARNPETHRCRKGQGVAGAAIAKVQDVNVASSAQKSQWALASLAVAGALAYALYEWRQDLTLKFSGAKSSLSSIGRRLKK